MAKPNAEKYNPSPEYMKSLREKARMTQDALAKRLGISRGAVQTHEADPSASSYRKAPYLYQYALEELARE